MSGQIDADLLAAGRGERVEGFLLAALVVVSELETHMVVEEALFKVELGDIEVGEDRGDALMNIWLDRTIARLKDVNPDDLW